MVDIPQRYVRQALFAGLGPEGQANVMRSSVAIVGCGGLGGVQAELLVRAGVGTVRLIDRETVEEVNLHRQILFDEDDARAARLKAVAAERRLHRVNSLVRIESRAEELNGATVGSLLAACDVVVDATDNLATRYLLNDYCIATGTPWVYGACIGAEGMTFAILPGETPCLRCVFPQAASPEDTPIAATAGVLGPIVGLIASLQAAEVLKIAAGRRDLVGRQIATIDVWNSSLQMLDLPPRDPGCSSCGEVRLNA